MVFNITFNNISVISWRSVVLVEETGIPRENHRPVASRWQTLSHNYPETPGTPVSSTNKTDRHDITEILLKVALNTIAIMFYGVHLPISRIWARNFNGDRHWLHSCHRENGYLTIQNQNIFNVWLISLIGV